MSSRPRRSAATKANEVISVHARWADSPERSEISERGTMSSRRSGRSSGVTRDAPSSPGDAHLSLTVKVPANRLREVTRGTNRRSGHFSGGEIVEGKRNRGTKKSYVVESSPDDDDDEEEEEEPEAEIEVGEEEDDDDDEDMDEDAEGEDEMEVDAEGEDVDAEGEEDAEGDIDMDLGPPTIRVSHPASRSKPAPRSSAAKVVLDDEDEDDDDDLSDPADSDVGDQTLGFGDETMADEDAEGEEIEVAGEEIDDDEEDADSDDDEEGSQDESPDLTKMTKRQRARFEDEPQQYMKLSDGLYPLSSVLIKLLT